MQSKVTRLVATIVIALSLFVTPISAATYNITQSQPLSWNASYKVAVNNNKITSISGLKVSVAFANTAPKRCLIPARQPALSSHVTSAPSPQTPRFTSNYPTANSLLA